MRVLPITILTLILLFFGLSFINAGERLAHINIADGKKSSVILASEAAKTDQVNRAQGELLYSDQKFSHNMTSLLWTSNN